MSDIKSKRKPGWQKGKSGNPNGRPKLSQEIKESRLFNKIEVESLLNRYMKMPISDLLKIAEDQSIPAIESVIAKVVALAAQQGDHLRFNFLLDRMIGKVKDQVEHTGKVTLEQLVIGTGEDDE